MRNLMQPRFGIAIALLLGIFASTVAYAQNPTFALEGVVGREVALEQPR